MNHATRNLVKQASALSLLMTAAVLQAKSSPVGETAISRATGAALQGDGVRARQIMLSISRDVLDDADQRLRTCVISRFTPGAPPAPPEPALRGLARASLEVYRAYWQTALLHPADTNSAERKLRLALAQLLKQPESASLDQLSADLDARLRREGWWSLQGTTGRLRELMLWRKQDSEQYSVRLPEGPFATTVFLLRDFASLGWGDYATCGRRGTGGWATKERLYAVVPRYPSLASEEFRVTFLGHETQHFADQRRWTLEPWHLEYRSKLVELAQVNDTRRRVLNKFTEDQKADPTFPHSYANLRVLRDLKIVLKIPSSADLLKIPVDDLHRAAALLLAMDSERVKSGLIEISTKRAGNNHQGGVRLKK